VELKIHKTISYLATSLDGDIPASGLVTEFKCIYPTTEFPHYPSSKYVAQLDSQITVGDRQGGCWLMVQLDKVEFIDSLSSSSITDDLKSSDALQTASNTQYDQWMRAIPLEKKLPMNIMQQGIFLQNTFLDEKDPNKYIYPPMDVITPEQHWQWMQQNMHSYDHSYKNYQPSFWTLRQYNFIHVRKDPEWLKYREPYLQSKISLF
jgi:hypothetical protein